MVLADANDKDVQVKYLFHGVPITVEGHVTNVTGSYIEILEAGDKNITSIPVCGDACHIEDIRVDGKLVYRNM